jgi:F0F1-type ATP synthase assembly protein I
VAFDGLNNQQLAAGSVTADVRQDGSAVTAATATASTDGSYFKLSGTNTVAAGKIYAVKAWFNGTAVGTQVSATAGTRTVATFTNSVVADANATGTSVRTDKPFVVNSVLKDGTSATAPVAGAAVTATITTSASLAALTSAATEKQITIAGTTYTANSKLPGGGTTDAVALVSDANGVVTLPISTNNFAAGDTITVSFASQNLTNATNLVVTETAADYTAYTNGGFAQTVDGTAASFPVKVYDQFGQALADGYYAVATWATSSQTTAATAASSTYAAITGGAATLSILDNGTGAGTNTYTLTVQKRNADGSYAGNLGTHTTSTLTVAVNATAVPAAGTVTVGGSFTQDSTSKVYYIGTATSQTAQALNLNTLAAVDTRFSATAAPTVGTGVVVGGNVKTAATASAAAANIQGQSVTVAAKGLEFLSTVDGRAVWSLDSATVATDSSGNYSVTVYSNTSGVQTVTVTAGAATATAKIKFAAPAGNTGKTLVITAPDSVLPGQNVAFTATLTDKYGNAVNTATATAANSFKFSGTGVGNIAAAVTATGDDGTATLTASTGSADAGTITLTAVYSTDGTAANTTTVTKKVKVAAPAAAALAAKAAASAAQTGSAIAVTATATDAAGKPVAGVVVNFANAGTGYLSAASATTDANGLATVQLIGNVAGANAVTATAGAATATANVKFGNADATLSNVGKRVTAAWSYAGGKKVIVSVNGTKVESLIASDDAADSYSFNAKKGTNKISVSIAGVVVDTLTVKVKK